MTPEKKRAPRNRTLTLTEQEYEKFRRELLTVPEKDGITLSQKDISGKIIHGDTFRILRKLPDSFVDLLILDPPYNLDKRFGTMTFSSSTHTEYLAYLESFFFELPRLLKPSAGIYLCGDWKCSAADFLVMSKYFHVRNRIVWQREKGRGARANWKNCAEDIWFGTVSDSYTFHADSVKLRRRVLAPYRNRDGEPKDWHESAGEKFRFTAPSNFWDDISVPYWSMPENTDHPTQKPEKLLAKLILASSNPGDFVFDPFLGSGTTAVAAKKLGRNFSGIERCTEYCCWAAARLERAESSPGIQGYSDGFFRERNS